MVCVEHFQHQTEPLAGVTQAAPQKQSRLQAFQAQLIYTHTKKKIPTHWSPEKPW